MTSGAQVQAHARVRLTPAGPGILQSHSKRLNEPSALRCGLATKPTGLLRRHCVRSSAAQRANGRHEQGANVSEGQWKGAETVRADDAEAAQVPMAGNDHVATRRVSTKHSRLPTPCA